MKASDNPFPTFLAVEGTTPASPAAGRQKLFIDSADHKLKRVNSSGTVVTVEGTGAGGGIGASSLVYRYTITGADKASVDTGVDTADAGSNDWTNGDLLEVFWLSRTDDAGAIVNIDMTVNNDTGANYDIQQLHAISTTPTGVTSLAQTKWALSTHGSGGAAGYPGVNRIVFPDFTGTVLNKTADQSGGLNDGTATNELVVLRSLGWRSTAAITRIKFAAQSTAKFKIGSQLLIYKRLAS